MEVLGSTIILSDEDNYVFARFGNKDINDRKIKKVLCLKYESPCYDRYGNDNDEVTLGIEFEDGVKIEYITYEILNIKYCKNPTIKPEVVHPNLSVSILESDKYYVKGHAIDIGDFDLHGRQVKSARNV